MGIWVLEIQLEAVIGIFIVRNVARLWRVPSAETRAWTAMPLLLTIGVVLVFLGLRDAVRVRPSAIRGTYWQQ